MTLLLAGAVLTAALTGCGTSGGADSFALNGAFLQTRMGIPSILAGIIVNTGLYTVNIAVMGYVWQTR